MQNHHDIIISINIFETHLRRPIVDFGSGTRVPETTSRRREAGGQEMSTAASRPLEIESMLVSSEQYGEATIGTLEAYVKDQIKQGTYDFAANKALVKLYQLYPWRCQSDVLVQVLGLAVAARPATDFKALLYSCPANLVEGPLAKKLIDLDGLLDASKFGTFFKEVDPKIVDLVPSFEASIRNFILGLLAETTQSVPLETFNGMCGLALTPEDPLPFPSTIVQKDGATITFAPNPENQARQPGLGKAIGLGPLLALFDDEHNFVIHAPPKHSITK